MSTAYPGSESGTANETLGGSRTPGTPYRKGRTRAVELYLGNQARQVLLSGHQGLDRSTILLLAIEHAANTVAKDHPKIEFAGIFTGSACQLNFKYFRVAPPGPTQFTQISAYDAPLDSYAYACNLPSATALFTPPASGSS